MRLTLRVDEMRVGDYVPPWGVIEGIDVRGTDEFAVRFPLETFRWGPAMKLLCTRPAAFPTPEEHVAGAGETVDLDAEDGDEDRPGERAAQVAFSALDEIAGFLRESDGDALDAEPMMRWFDYKHLPDDLAMISGLVGSMAGILTVVLPRTAERTVALRKLLEAKDAAVRCALEARDGAL